MRWSWFLAAAAATPLLLLVLQPAVEAFFLNGNPGAIVGALSDFLPPIFYQERAKTFRREDRSDRREFDFIIVGAGPAGCALAKRLTERNDWNVLMLEAGGEEVPVLTVPFFLGQFHKTDANWQYVTTRQNHSCAFLEDSRCDYPQGRLLGGGTGINYMFNIRGNRRDFDDWASQGNPGWSYNDLLPYFRKVEHTKIPELQRSPYHGYGGSVMTSYPPYLSGMGRLIMRAGQEMGLPSLDYNGEHQEGVHRIQTTTNNGVRWTANTAYLRHIRNRHNFFLRPRSFVTRLIISDSGHVNGVRYRRGGREYEAFASKEVILSAGAVNSPALLMRSGIGPKDHLKSLGIPVVRDLPVGLNLQEHTGIISLYVVMNESRTPSIPEIMLNPKHQLNYYIHKGGPLTSTGTFETVSFHDLAGTRFHSPGWPAVEILHSSMNPATDPKSASLFRVTRHTYDTLLRPLEGKPVYQACIWVLRPKSRGSVYLKNANPDTPPEIDVNALSHPDDVEMTLAGIRLWQKLISTPSFRRVGAQQVGWNAPGCSHLPPDSDDFWRCSIRGYSLTIYHPTGTCKMGPADDPTSVVTPDLKVKWVSGLRVVDSSIPPTIISGHLQMTSYVIGEKAADMIKAEYSR